MIQTARIDSDPSMLDRRGAEGSGAFSFGHRLTCAGRSSMASISSSLDDLFIQQLLRVLKMMNEGRAIVMLPEEEISFTTSGGRTTTSAWSTPAPA